MRTDTAINQRGVNCYHTSFVDMCMSPHDWLAFTYFQKANPDEMVWRREIRQHLKCDVLCKSSSLLTIIFFPLSARQSQPRSVRLFSKFWLQWPTPTRPNEWVSAAHMASSQLSNPVNYITLHTFMPAVWVLLARGLISPCSKKVKSR